MAKRTALLVLVALTLLACGPGTQATPTPLAQATATTAATAVRPAATTAPTPTAKPTTAPTAASPAAGPKYGGILTFNLRGDPQSPDPWVRVQWDTQEVTNYVHARLSRTDRGPEPCATRPLDPELATGWKWTSDTILEITLRQGVRFPSGEPYNGREFTADDFLYTATVQWPRSSVYTPIMGRVKKVEKTDKYGVRFVLDEPFADLIETVVENPRLPVAGPELFGKDNAVPRVEQAGLGPFRITKYTPGVKVDFLKNNDYWRKGVPYLDGLKGLVMPDFAMVAAAVRSGKLDTAELFGNMPIGLALQQSNPELQFVWCPATSPNALFLPSDEAPFSDVRVRRAIAMAIDRDALRKVLWGNNNLPSYSIVGPGLSDIFLEKADYPPEVRQYLEYSPDKARALLSEAGFPQGFEMLIHAQARRRDRVATAETIAAMLTKVGIKVELRIPDDPAFLATVRQGRYSGGMIYPLSDESKSQLLNWLGTNPASVNYGRIKDSTLDDLLNEFERVTDPAKRKEIARNIQLRSVGQMVAVPIGVAQDPAVRQPWVKGVPPKFKAWITSDYIMYGWLDR